MRSSQETTLRLLPAVIREPVRNRAGKAREKGGRVVRYDRNHPKHLVPFVYLI
jgi:hypothetical protein